MKKTASIILVAGACLVAQTISISGKVSNTSGQAISGAIVQLVASQVKDTTDANGNYSLIGPGISPVRQRAETAPVSGITYKDGHLLFHVATPVAVAAHLFRMNGARVATIYNGLLQPGLTAIPLALNQLGRTAYLLHLQCGGQYFDYRLIPMGTNAFRISALSPGAGMLAKAVATDWLQATKTGYASHVEKVSLTSGTIDIVMSATTAPNFGPNTYIFDPSMATATMQSQVNTIFKQQETNQFGTPRYAILLKPGTYALDINVAFYTEVMGLGLSPDSVVINGAVRSEADWFGGNGTQNFWRSAAGMCIVPPSGSTRWVVSQAAPYRRMHVKGNLDISDPRHGASGGFTADSRIEGSIRNWQQQWLSRNSEYKGWSSTGWNFVFVGCSNPPAGVWPNPPFTVVPKTPIIREKPFLYIDNSGSYSVMVPDLKKDSTIGISWANGPITGTSVPIDQFYIALAATDNDVTINAALDKGKNLLLTPGIYRLNASIKVMRPGTIVLGIGFPTLYAEKGTPAIETADVDGLKIGGFLIDASPTLSANLMAIGEPGAKADHAANPSCFWDIFCRAGGQFAGQTSCMLTVNSNNVIVDHCWLWRADHGAGANWNVNKNPNGLIVNGSNVTMYGVFVEHMQEYQTIWNGNGGRVYLYQSEFPYDMPSQSAWKNGSGNGWASYKVANTVSSHECWAGGAYAAIHTSGVVVDNAFEVPANVAGIKMRRLLTVGLSSNVGIVTHIINGVGASAVAGNGSSNVARLAAYP